jgi:transcriptional regulator with GAF, ATPase, and Fis domain
VDDRIEDALSRLVRTLGLDRSALFQADADGDFVHTHQWTRPGWAPPPPRVSARDHFPWHLARVRAGEFVCVSSLDEVPDDVDRESLRRIGTRSSVTMPLLVGGQVWGAMTFAAVRQERAWTSAEINRLRVVAHIFAGAIGRRAGDQRLRWSLDEANAERDRLRDENRYLRDELKAVTGAAAIVGHSRAIRRVLEQIRQVATTDATVLIAGEIGTGKTLLAGRLHELSARGERALVRVDCTSLSPDRIESRLELAAHSSVFLDEVADLPLDAQTTLMRRGMDVRVIAATRRDLKRCIDEGTFREDLYTRLTASLIHVPPLRERREDIPLLVWRFVDEFSAVLGKPIDAIDQGSMDALQAHGWPGNARELRNVVERAMIAPGGRRLHIPPPAGAGSVHRPAAAARTRRSKPHGR